MLICRLLTTLTVGIELCNNVRVHNRNGTYQTLVRNRTEACEPAETFKSNKASGGFRIDAECA